MLFPVVLSLFERGGGGGREKLDKVFKMWVQNRFIQPHSNVFCFILQPFPSNSSHSSWVFCLFLLCCWIDNIMDSSIKPLRKEILELIASSETITECVFPPMCITAHLSTMSFICHFVKVFDNTSLGIHSSKLSLPCRVCSAEFTSRLLGALTSAQGEQICLQTSPTQNN